MYTLTESKLQVSSHTHTRSYAREVCKSRVIKMVVTIISLLMTGVAGATLAVTFSLWGVLKDDVLANQFPIVGPGWSLWMTWAAIGFVCGAVIWYGLLFLRVRIIRLLLSYDHWFIRKPNCFDWVSLYFPSFSLQEATRDFEHSIYQLWALCLKMLMDSKNLGFRGYQDILPTLPIPSLQATCKRYT